MLISELRFRNHVLYCSHVVRCSSNQTVRQLFLGLFFSPRLSGRPYPPKLDENGRKSPKKRNYTTDGVPFAEPNQRIPHEGFRPR